MEIYQVDAFTDQPFAGNPAAVCLLTEERPAAWMQQVAREMNLSETAFVRRQADGFSLRWFTPAVEVELCGHATLATAHILWQVGWLAADDEARFHTLSGLLTASRQGDGIQLDFPATPAEPAPPPAGLVEALGVAPLEVGRTGSKYLVVVEREEMVRALAPDMAALKALGVRGVMVTAQASSPGLDFVSRYFAPSVGVDEDPVTGSAHCCLGPHWAGKLGLDEMRAYQASARGGELVVRVVGDRVQIRGQAVTVLSGRLHVD